ncbi:anti-sigma factor family protein [Actinomadura gamaensis]|uniref:Anti-sigma factor family protein n=1 Tax=Actinomadura gamaensis TaxID=1763541 RepID=A0ABV9U1P5_9ACTN
MISPHLDYDTLADLAEGMLEDDLAASANAHLDTCAECRDRSADLADVSRILAEAPLPSMPAELAERIDSALAAESLHTATVVSLEQRRKQRHWRVLSAAAAAVVVLGGGAAVGTNLLRGGGSHDGSASVSSPVTDPSGGAAPSAAGSGVAPSAAATGGYEVVTSGTDYHAASLGGQVAKALTGRTRNMTMQSGSSAGLQQCLAALAKSVRPVLVDQARFDGSPAVIVALPGPSAGRYDVWVVRPTCTPRDQQVISHTQVAG